MVLYDQYVFEFIIFIIFLALSSFLTTLMFLLHKEYSLQFFLKSADNEVSEPLFV